MYHDKYNLFTRTLKAENGTLSLLLDQPFVGAFKSAVTNCFNLLHWLIHHFIILFIYLFIYYYYYILLLLLFFLFCTFTVMGKNRKALYRLSQSYWGTFLTLKCHFWVWELQDINWVVLFHLPETVTLYQILIIILQKAQ